MTTLIEYSDSHEFCLKKKKNQNQFAIFQLTTSMQTGQQNVKILKKKLWRKKNEFKSIEIKK